MRARVLHMRGVVDRRDACRDRRRIDVERPADAVDRVDHMRGPVHPAEPQRREPVDLREGARHHDVVAGGDQLDAGFVIVAPDIFRIGGVEHQQHMRRQRPGAGA